MHLSSSIFYTENPLRKNRKIGIFIPEFPGQTHSFFWREIKALQQHHGYDPQVISTRLPPQKVSHEWVKEAEADYLYPIAFTALLMATLKVVLRLPGLLIQQDVRDIMRSPKYWALLTMAAHLGRICKREKIGHLHVHSCANAALVAALCHRMDDVSYSLVLHGPITDYGPHQAFKWRQANFVFVITEKLQSEMEELLPEAANKMQIVPMGVDTERFAPSESPTEAPPPFNWFSCARLNRIKGFETLLEAVAILAETHPDLRFNLNIAGEDESGGSGYRKTLEKIIADRALYERVRLLGAVTQSDVLSQLHNAHGFVLASLHEPLGVAYMEAMACGLPVVGTNAGGVTELITHQADGLLVAAEDANSLADAMYKIMTDADLRRELGIRARHKVQENFGSRRSADALSAALIGNGQSGFND